jgi:hypothetical protein
MSPLNIYEEQDSHLNRMNIIVEQLNGVLTGQNVLNHSDNLDQIVIALHIERDHLNIEEKFSEIAGPVQNVMPEQDLNLIPQAELVINQYNEIDEDTASENNSISMDSSNDSRLEDPTPRSEEEVNKYLFVYTCTTVYALMKNL